METVYASLVGQSNDGIGGVMVASLAAAATGYDLTPNRTRFRRQVAACMSINPQATGDDNDAPSRDMAYQHILRLNAASVILYLVNYYAIVPTAHVFAATLGSRSSGAALIGMANIGSVTSSFFHVLLISKPKSFIRKRVELIDLRVPLILCSVFAILGNMLYSYSVTKTSLAMALGARFLVGLGSAEVLNRQLLATAVPQETINTEVARLTKKSFLTISVALLLGSLVDITVEDRSDFTFQSENMLPALVNPMLSLSASVTDNSTLMNAPETQASSTSATSSTIIPSLGRHRLFSLQSLGYVMMSLWFAQMIGLLLFFDVPKNKRKRRKASVNQNNLANHTQEEDFDSDSQSVIADEIGHGDDGTLEKLQTMSRKPSKNGHSHHTYMESITEIRRLLVSNVACPTTIAVLCIAKTTGEVVLSSCGSIAHRYFDWSGARSGLFMGLIATMILPINLTLASERNYTERGIMKLALVVARWGLILMVNYEALFFFAISLVKGSMREESSTGRIYYYDSIFGGVQYVVSFTIIFLSVVTLESVTLALISKVQVAPRQMRKYTIDTSFVVMLISALSRLIGDTLIVAFDASSWALFNNDIVNSLCFVLIIAVTIGIYFVKKHYFFLI